jgi:hypothetical protein
MRIRCELFGCLYDSYCGCVRCGAGLYEYEFLQEPCWALKPFYDAKFWLSTHKWWLAHKCAGEKCWQWMFFTHDHCCSEKCYSSWVPF